MSLLSFARALSFLFLLVILVLFPHSSLASRTREGSRGSASPLERHSHVSPSGSPRAVARSTSPKPYPESSLARIDRIVQSWSRDAESTSWYHIFDDAETIDIRWLSTISRILPHYLLSHYGAFGRFEIVWEEVTNLSRAILHIVLCKSSQKIHSAPTFITHRGIKSIPFTDPASDNPIPSVLRRYAELIDARFHTSISVNDSTIHYRHLQHENLDSFCSSPSLSRTLISRLPWVVSSTMVMASRVHFIPSPHRDSLEPDLFLHAECLSIAVRSMKGELSSSTQPTSSTTHDSTIELLLCATRYPEGSRSLFTHYDSSIPSSNAQLGGAVIDTPSIHKYLTEAAIIFTASKDPLTRPDIPKFFIRMSAHYTENLSRLITSPLPTTSRALLHIKRPLRPSEIYAPTLSLPTLAFGRDGSSIGHVFSAEQAHSSMWAELRWLVKKIIRLAPFLSHLYPFLALPYISERAGIVLVKDDLTAYAAIQTHITRAIHLIPLLPYRLLPIISFKWTDIRENLDVASIAAELDRWIRALTIIQSNDPSQADFSSSVNDLHTLIETHLYPSDAATPMILSLLAPNAMATLEDTKLALSHWSTSLLSHTIAYISYVWQWSAFSAKRRNLLAPPADVTTLLDTIPSNHLPRSHDRESAISDYRRLLASLPDMGSSRPPATLKYDVDGRWLKLAGKFYAILSTSLIPLKESHGDIHVWQVFITRTISHSMLYLTRIEHSISRQLISQAGHSAPPAHRKAPNSSNSPKLITSPSPMSISAPKQRRSTKRTTSPLPPVLSTSLKRQKASPSKRGESSPPRRSLSSASTSSNRSKPILLESFIQFITLWFIGVRDNPKGALANAPDFPSHPFSRSLSTLDTIEEPLLSQYLATDTGTGSHHHVPLSFITSSISTNLKSLGIHLRNRCRFKLDEKAQNEEVCSVARKFFVPEEQIVQATARAELILRSFHLLPHPKEIGSACIPPLAILLLLSWQAQPYLDQASSP